MSWSQGSLGVDLAWVLLWGATLGFVYFAVFRALDLLPLGDDRRSTLRRVRPVASLFAALIFCLFASHALFSRYPEVLPIAMLLVLVGFFVASRGLVRDYFAGVALRAEQSLEVGDHIRLLETKGRITELGPRAIALITSEGDSALIPYTRAAQHPIVRTRTVKKKGASTFELDAIETLSPAELERVVERAALQHHWGAVARPPEMNFLAGGSVEVTVFSLAQEHAADVEVAVRQAVKKAAGQ